MSSIRENSRTLASALGAIIVVCAASARAQDGAAMAETLFKEAKDLMAHGDYAAACPKLAESNRLDPGAGTLTALALCHEAQGKTASAWAEFIEVQSAAQQAQRSDREALAKQHIATLEPLLPHLTIRVDAKIADLKVFRDDVVVGSAAWASPLAVNPGEHVIRAEASGYKPFSVPVTMAASETKTIVVPALEELPKMAALTPVIETPEKPRDGGTQRIAAIVIGSTGLVALGFGTFFGVSAISDASTANSLCATSPCSNTSAVQTNNDAKTNALAADILIGVGAAAIVTAVIVYLVAPHAPKVSAAIRGTSLRIAF